MFNRLFNLTVTRVALLVGALMAISLVALPVYNLAFAQEDGSIGYAENGMGPVATFTGVDPEGQTVYWSLLTALPNPNVEVDGDPLAAEDFEDNGDFSISGDGVLSFNIPPDHESPDDASPGDNEYMIVVVASDGAPGSGTDDAPIQMGYHKVVVEVTDEDEAGVITLSSLQPQVGAMLTASLSDVEVTPNPPTNANDLTWEWERSQDMSSWTVIPGAVAATLTPDDDDVDHYVRVTATYEVAADDDTERTSQAVSVNKARAAPATADATAVFPSTPTDANNRSVDENLPAGTDVGDPVAATDTVDDVLTYSLTGANTGGFEIDPATGQITVGPRTVLDADNEDTDEYTVTVTVTEASGDPMNQPVTITVNDLNEAPMVTGGVTMAEHEENTAATEVVSTYAGSDPEGNAITWSVEGADADKFEIVETNGALTFEEAPNYEMPADAGGNNVYNVTVVATDNGVDTDTDTDGDGENEMTAMRDVVIMVTDLKEAGTVELSAQQPKAGIALTASVTDLDLGVTGMEWQWYDGPISTASPPDYTENAIADATSATYTPVDGDVGDTLSARVTYTRTTLAKMRPWHRRRT